MENKINRQIFLDIETTGINQTGFHYKGHKIIEIGAVEAINRRLTGNNFHTYLKPNRLIDLEAFRIHGISDKFLLDKPTFSEVVDVFFKYIRDAELIVHNALFDISFIDYESSKLKRVFPKVDTFCKVVDSLTLARKLFPGKRNNLDALCLRFKIDKSKRTLHGALLDAQILADIYLAMTSSQFAFPFHSENKTTQFEYTKDKAKSTNFQKIRVILANDLELIEHQFYIDLIVKKSGNCLWNLYT